MDGYTIETYGDVNATEYDTWHPTGADVADAVEFLAAEAGPGPVLELGIGTGRIAIPLAARGVQVHGIEASPRMVERLKEKPGGDAITVVQGDMADVAAPHAAYRLVYTSFSTFWMLLTQDEQVRCLCNVADRLTDGGLMVIEGSLPDLATLAER